MRNVTIEPLNLPKEKLDRLNRILNSNLCEYQKNVTKRRISGTCSMCDKIPSQIVKYPRFGVIIVEKHCDKCLERMQKLI